MQSIEQNLGLQELSDMLISKTRELTQLLEMNNHDRDTMYDLAIELAKLQEAIKMYWEKQKVLQS